MISILIPTYNYNAFPLAEALEKQALKLGIVFELICIDDGSFSHLNIKNQNINTLTNCKFLELKKNIGRTANRQLLAEKAQYDWLLFLDSDTMPKSNQFLENYKNIIELKKEAVFGGFTYKEQAPKKDFILRWKYGKIKEQVPAEIRNKTPYKVIISANFIIKKSIFIKLNAKLNFKGYGLDNYFGLLLKQNDIKIHHVNNEVYHLGLDESIDYLSKTEQAADTLLRLIKENKLITHSNSLLKLFIFLQRFGLHSIFAFVFKKYSTHIRKNLISKNPSIKLLQLYRISYMCYSYKNNK